MDLPGCATDRQGGQRHGMESRSNPKEILAERCAGEVVDWLEASHRRKAFEHLYLVASSQFLSLLRNRRSQGFADTVKAESGKDLTRRVEIFVQTGSVS